MKEVLYNNFLIHTLCNDNQSKKMMERRKE